MPEETSSIIALLDSLTGGNPVIAGIMAGAFIMITTSLGAAAIFLFSGRRRISFHLSMSFAAGIMLAASFTSLILPAIDMAGFIPTVASGILMGFLVLIAVERALPHEHLVLGYEGPESAKKIFKKAWLLAIAVIIHNFPEGLAVGVSVAYSIPLGLATALAIGIQDVPEGLAVALPVSSLSGRSKGFIIGVISGLSELVMAVIGAMVFNELRILLPLGMSFSGGAMLYVTLKEVIPEVYGENYSPMKATAGFLSGFLVMLYLDSAL